MIKTQSSHSKNRDRLQSVQFQDQSPFNKNHTLKKPSNWAEESPPTLKGSAKRYHTLTNKEGCKEIDKMKQTMSA